MNTFPGLCRRSVPYHRFYVIETHTLVRDKRGSTMCVAVPAEVIEIKEGNIGLVDYAMLPAGSKLKLVDVKVGEFVLVHVGFAIQRLSREEGLETRGPVQTGLRRNGELMHGYSIAYDLYATARSAAYEHHAVKIKKISVEVGRMAMVNPEQVVYFLTSSRKMILSFKMLSSNAMRHPRRPDARAGIPGTRFTCALNAGLLSGTGEGQGDRSHQCGD